MRENKFKNLKIGKKIAFYFLIVLIITSYATGSALFNLRKSGKLVNGLYNGPYQLTNQIMEIRDHLALSRVNVNAAYLTENIEKYRELADGDFDRIEEYLQKSNSIDNELGDYFINLKQETEKIYKLIEAKDWENVEKALSDENSSYIKVYNEIDSKTTKIYEEANKSGADFAKGVGKTVTRSNIVGNILTPLSIIMAILVGIRLTKVIKKPIDEIEIAAKQMAKGDFNVEINYQSKDELGCLSDSMRQMCKNTKEIIYDTVNVLGEVAEGNFRVEPKVKYVGVYGEIKKSTLKITNELSKTISQINEASEEVEEASEQVASGAQMLSYGSTEQANAIEELSATISDISDKIIDTAKNAREANDLSANSEREVSEGNRQMEQMVEAMEEISSTSNEIRRIIKTIDDIAFQTNILALNAAVEAARAGTAGKGFAVVAEEVRNLAAKSAEAAKNTSTLIENSIKAVNNGTYIVDNTAQSLHRIIETTNQTTALIDLIAKASEEQADAITQATLGLSQISEVVQNNTATSEESAAASEELSGQAQMLKSLIEQFKVI